MPLPLFLSCPCSVLPRHPPKYLQLWHLATGGRNGTKQHPPFPPLGLLLHKCESQNKHLGCSCWELTLLCAFCMETREGRGRPWLGKGWWVGGRKELSYRVLGYESPLFKGIQCSMWQVRRTFVPWCGLQLHSHSHTHTHFCFHSNILWALTSPAQKGPISVSLHLVWNSSPWVSQAWFHSRRPHEANRHIAAR